MRRRKNGNFTIKEIEMRTKIFTVFLLLFVFSPAFAGENRDHDHGAMQKEQASRQALSAIEKEELLNVLKANEGLHISFFNRSFDDAEKAAKKVIKAIDKMSGSKIKNKLLFAKEKLSQINSSRSRAENNRDYHLISMALIHLIGKYDVGSVYNGYYCPMEKKKWVQNSKKSMKVKNPFASDSMPACGDMITHY